jgi:hypothetical protein
VSDGGIGFECSQNSEHLAHEDYAASFWVVAMGAKFTGFAYMLDKYNITI